jgi:hypothetical protein
MEQTGTAFSLVTQDDLSIVHSIERTLGKGLERRRVNGFETVLKESKKNKTVNKNSRMSQSRAQNHYRSSAKHS